MAGPRRSSNLRGSRMLAAGSVIFLALLIGGYYQFYVNTTIDVDHSEENASAARLQKVEGVLAKLMENLPEEQKEQLKEETDETEDRLAAVEKLVAKLAKNPEAADATPTTSPAKKKKKKKAARKVVVEEAEVDDKVDFEEAQDADSPAEKEEQEEKEEEEDAQEEKEEAPATTEEGEEEEEEEEEAPAPTASKKKKGKKVRTRAERDADREAKSAAKEDTEEARDESPAKATKTATEEGEDEEPGESPEALFHSVGKTKAFFGGDLEADGVFDDALEKRSYKKELILLISDSRFIDMVTNLILNFEDLGIAHYLIVGASKGVCTELKAGGIAKACGHSTYVEKKDQDRWGIPPKDKLWLLRWHYMALAAEKGYNVLSTDADVIYHYDPYPFFKNQLKDQNLIVQSENYNEFPAINVGLIYVQNAHPNGAAVWILKEIGGKVDKTLASPVQYCRDKQPARSLLWEQNIFNDVAEQAVCQCEGRLRGLACTYQQDSEFIEYFSSKTRPEFKWMEGKSVEPSPVPGAAQLPATFHLASEWAVHYRPIYKLPDPDATEEEDLPTETIAAAPYWMFSLVIDAQGWTGVAPAPNVVTHFVTLAVLKRPYMKAYGLWDPRSDETPGAAREFDEGLRVLALASAPLQYDTRAEFQSAVARFTALAVLTNRRPVIPLASCDSEWINRRNTAAHNIQDHDIIATSCDGAGGELICCYYMPLMDTCLDNRHVMHPMELPPFLQRLPEQPDISVVDVAELDTVAQDPEPGRDRGFMGEQHTPEVKEISYRNVAKLLGEKTSQIVFLKLPDPAAGAQNPGELLPIVMDATAERTPVDLRKNLHDFSYRCHFGRRRPPPLEFNL